MFIQTEETSNPDVVKFLPGRDVSSIGDLSFVSVDQTEHVPLARRLLDLESVVKVGLGSDNILITRSRDADWHELRPRVLAAIMDHFVSGAPVIEDAFSLESDEPEEELVGPAADVREIVNTRIRPAARGQRWRCGIHGIP